MATVVVFHSALGLRPAIESLAETFRDDGHQVATPDLYAGRVFDDLDEGVAERDRIGFTELLARATAGVETLPEPPVYIGLSLGTAPALLLGTQRPGTRGIALIQGVLPLEAIGLSAWPDGLPLQLHTSHDDPWHEQEPLDELVAAVPPHLLQVHDHPGCGHLFLDTGLPEHDTAATARLVEALRGWLDGPAASRP